jgi:hypothetical protein
MYLRCYNDYLFSDYIPRLKTAMAREALERNLKWVVCGTNLRGSIHALTANQADAASGELNFMTLGRNCTIQNVLRMAPLAPDFLEARGRFVGHAVKPYGREQAVDLIAGALGRRKTWQASSSICCPTIRVGHCPGHRCVRWVPIVEIGICV